jgi:hypothetical protein
MYSNNVEILLGVGNGQFTAGNSYPVGQVPHSICHGDFNGDGIVDLATANINSDNVTVLIGNGDGTFQAGVNYPTGKGTTSIYPADFSGNGITDLVAANSGSSSPGLVVSDSSGSSQPSSVSILMGNGDGTFQPAVNYSTGDGGNGVVSTVLTPNGFQDLAVCFFGSYVTVLLGNGNGTFGSGATTTTTTLTSSVNPSNLNQSVTYTATVTPSTATGKVTFSHGSTVMGTGTLSNGTATLVYSALPAGGHDLIASYGGDANDAPSVSPVLVQVVD